MFKTLGGKNMKTKLFDQVKDKLYKSLEPVVEKTQRVAEKARESAEVAKAKLEVKKLEGKIAIKFGELGGKIYEVYFRKGIENPISDMEVKQLLEELISLDRDLTQTQANLEKKKQEEKKTIETKV
jgi:hypothetical protein